MAARCSGCTLAGRRLATVKLATAPEALLHHRRVTFETSTQAPAFAAGATLAVFATRRGAT